MSKLPHRECIHAAMAFADPLTLQISAEALMLTAGDAPTIPDIAAARAEGRREGLEEALRIAESPSLKTAWAIADRIRALLTQSPPSATPAELPLCPACDANGVVRGFGCRLCGCFVQELGTQSPPKEPTK